MDAGCQQRVSVNSVRSIELTGLIMRALHYLKISREKGVLGLEGEKHTEPLDLFREALELLIDGCPAEEVSSYLAISREQTMDHLAAIYAVIDDMVAAVAAGKNCYLVAKRANLYLRGQSVDSLPAYGCDECECRGDDSIELSI